MALSEAFYRDLLDAVYEGIVFVDPAGVITFWSKGAEALLGHPADAMLGVRFDESLAAPQDASGNPARGAACLLLSTLADGEPRSGEMRYAHADGHVVGVVVQTGTIPGEGGACAGAVETFADNSGRNKIMGLLKEVEDLALLDPLTALPNRGLLAWSMQERMHGLRRYGDPFGVLLVDIDRFKTVNDERGHLVGDEVLRSVAQVLAQDLRNSDVIGRWGGEEFLALLPYADKQTLELLGERLRALVASADLGPPDDPVHVTVSIGGTEGQDDDTSASLFERVDRLMFRSKEEGRDRVTVG